MKVESGLSVRRSLLRKGSRTTCHVPRSSHYLACAQVQGASSTEPFFRNGRRATWWCWINCDSDQIRSVLINLGRYTWKMNMYRRSAILRYKFLYRIFYRYTYLYHGCTTILYTVTQCNSLSWLYRRVASSALRERYAVWSWSFQEY